ncbi:unnamed protein product [Arabidopsis lyrata]|uniref:Predicted protein n=1 Tax=Arabidopsis lyrata subsp. lyrata TaxID=81972 RepID=D7L3I3_ARALL|nr:probable thionin-2.3 isoform X1 [Arabidopsis lyrata subsp. lyrata]EFH60131.1 predicted protein [Arabidopsis lyrata subsp. lyrata]CAH8262278.1 unnamed protein product [Arabidopsis lyrata]|eukprot:XP_002883872.1 probable thionin-2.3 isoform X1 [Arabidopsis lyrata subsp. lyrata]
MEGKTVIFSVLVMGLVIWQIQVDAQEQRTCCPSQSSREEFEDCISQGNLHTVCGAGSGCLESYVGFCPSQYPYGSLTNSGDVVSVYCKLGCVSSLCGALTSLQKSDTSGKVNEAVERCSKTCSTICTKGSKTAVETV